MKPRDLVIVAAVALLAVFALADALRGRLAETVAPTTPTPPTRTEPRDVEVGPGNEGIPGRFVFTDEFCMLEELNPSSGRVRVTGLEGTCRLSGPLRTGRLAHGQPGPPTAAGRGTWFRVLDIDHPRRELGGVYALPDSVIWAMDANRVAWCDGEGRGWERVLGGRRTPLRGCPIAYTRNGKPAFARGRELVVGGTTVATAPGPIKAASFGEDGSLAVLAGNTLLRYGTAGDPRPISTLRVPHAFPRRPIFARDNCGALFPWKRDLTHPLITVVGLSCARHVRATTLLGREAVWSPDGLLFAIADDGGIAVYDPRDPREPVRFHTRATELLWKDAR